ncbi:3-isopropylmalate dehydratase small subunit [Pseudarthrobacter sp. NIBRBAC000502772]|uniref:3-isopropylmalate dehydratase small subunit n=1 Tax=Pseudarthrobacter sp. NIBRBAC000502772 TaxID=2590775 RepID=UPI00113038E8|nr:3-isopropylmalate dehydratase small subunit [Pseudarthrobacter sp. NIBRBAC000502772]QDG65218.1 3-isopropylmalate dehydratase small subunit [Pseudarthrobacter sp. NIBRBAC000502772]
MQRFTVHTGVAMPLNQTNVDTDQIIPSKFLKRISRTGFADALFADLREDAKFPLDNPQFSGASILVTGADFGTGSSREHAVWALMDYGFKVVISPKFADIFRGNCGKSGLVAAKLNQEEIDEIWRAIEADPGLEITLNLADQSIVCAEHEYIFDIDNYVKWRLLEGLDDIDLTELAGADIESFEAQRPNFLPTTP